jgi:glutamate-1-semialdehyde 2,1-aminomutase
MKVVAVIQARMGSTRLPGKVLMKLGIRPVLGWVIEGVRKASLVDKIVVATSTLDADTPIVKYVEEQGVACYRGSETDVLHRVRSAAIEHNADLIVRITGDCPFIDPDVIDQVILLANREGVAYASNINPPTWPDGLDVQVCTRQALAAADSQAVTATDRDTVMQYIVRNRHTFPAANLVCPIPGLEKLRWVLDDEDDLLYCRKLEKHIMPGFPYSYIVGLIDKYPELQRKERPGSRNERFLAALASEPYNHRGVEGSGEWLEKANAILPLGTTTYSKSHVAWNDPHTPLYLTHGEAGHVFDIDGNEYVDLIGALGPVILGYCDADVDRAVRAQLDRGISFSLGTPREAEVAEELVGHIGWHKDNWQVAWSKNGSDAVTCALRVARTFTGRNAICVDERYHGWHDAMLALDPMRKRGIQQNQDVHTLHKGLLPKSVGGYAAVIIDPSLYVETFKQSSLVTLKEQCDKQGTLLIFDEILSGFRYREGTFSKWSGIEPDILCLSKGLANGLPLAATIGSRVYMTRISPPNNCFFSGTFFGESLSLAACRATMRSLAAGSADALSRNQVALRKIFASIIPELAPQRISIGRPPMSRLEFANPRIAKLFRRHMAKNGVLIFGAINAMASHTSHDMVRVKTALEATCLELQKNG